MKLMRVMPVLWIVLSAAPLAAQAPTRAQTMAAEFNKYKNAVKTKHGVTVHKFHEVVSEAWLLSPSGYAGVYVSEAPATEIAVARDGSVSGSGFDGARYTLRSARITDGVLKATKVYANGRTEAFEAVFIKRRDRARPDDDFTVSYGIGFLAESGTGYDTPLRVFAMRQ